MTVLSELLPYKCGKVDWTEQVKQLILDICEINDESKHNSIHKFTLELMDHLSIKTPIDVKQRIAFANIYLQLALSPGARTTLVSLCCDVFCKLTKIGKGIKNNELSIDWKQLWNLLNINFIQKQAKSFPANLNCLHHILLMILSAKRFFVVTSVDEILEVFLPRLNFHDLHTFSQELYLLTLFLPITNYMNDMEVKLTNLTLDSDDSFSATITYMPTLFSLWSLSNNSAVVDAIILQHIACVSEFTDINYTKEQLDVIFTAGLLSFGLPAAENKQVSQTQNLLKHVNPIHESFACFVAYTIFQNDSVFERLERLLHTTETYYHPSNSGKWTTSLVRFIILLTTKFLARIRLESEKEKVITTIEMRENFVILLNSVSNLSMYTKQPHLAPQIQKNMLNLAFIHPCILKTLIPRAYSSISGGESHRCIGDLGAIAFVSMGGFFNAVEEKGNILDIMNMTIQAIDINDPHKTLSALLFYGNLAMHTPFIGNVYQYCIISLLRQFFYLFENLPHGNTSNTIETAILDRISRTCLLVFGQCDEEIMEDVMNVLYTYIDNSMELQAVKCVSKILSHALSYAPKHLDRFIKCCCLKIREEIEGGCAVEFGEDSINPWNIKRGDARFHWYQYILVACCNHVTVASFPLVEATLNEMIEKVNSRRGFKWTGQCILAVLVCFLNVRIMEKRSVCKSVWKSSEWRDQSLQSWHSYPSLNELNIEWHIATEQEINLACSLAIRVLEFGCLALEECRDECESQNGVSKEIGLKAEKWFSILTQILCGIGNLNMHFLGTTADPRCVTTGKINAATVHHDRLAIALSRLSLILLTFSPLFLKSSNSNFESVKEYVRLVETYIVPSHVSIVELESNIRTQLYTQKFLKTAGQKKVLPRHMLLSRIEMLHSQRILHNTSFGSHLPNIKKLCIVLYDLSVCSYAEIRKKAQVCLSSALRSHKLLRFDILNNCMEDFKSNDEEKIMGSLHVLNLSSVLECGFADWARLQKLVIGLCLLQTIEKTSIQNMVKSVLHLIMINITTISVLRPSEAVIDATNSFLNGTLEKSDLIQFLTDKQQRRKVTSANMHGDLTNELSERILMGKEHWWFNIYLIELLDLLTDPKSSVLSSNMAMICAANLNSELEIVRKVSLNLCIKMLQCIKHHVAKQEGSKKRNLKRVVKTRDFYSSGDDFLNKTCQIGADKNDWKNIAFVDDPTPWLLCAPREIQVIFGCESDSIDIFKDLHFAQCLDPLLINFNDALFWDKFFGMLSLEASSSSNKDFNKSSLKFFKYFFQIFEDKFMDRVMQIVTEFTLTYDDKWKQKAAAECLAGLLLGMKYWSKLKIENSWNILIPILENAFKNSTSEGSYYWKAFIRNACFKRDLRRLGPLIKLIFSYQIDHTSTSFFSEAKKIHFVKSIVKTCSWKCIPLLVPILNGCIANISNPYNQIRDIIAVTIRVILGLLWHPSYLSSKNLCMAASSGKFKETYSKSFDNFGNDVRSLLLTYKDAASSDISKLPAYINSSRTVLAILSSYFSSRSNPGQDIFIFATLEHIFGTIHIEDIEFQQLLQTNLIKIVCVSYDSVQLDRLACQIVLYMQENNLNWHIQVEILPLLRVLVFRNMFLMNVTTLKTVTDYVGELMVHNNVEVRSRASVALSSLIRCSNKHLIQFILDKYLPVLGYTLIPKKRFRDDSGSYQLNQDVLLRHSAALAITALVNSYPYDVPSWMPDVIMHLTRNISDQPLIANTIRKCLQEFKRTHQDTWHEDSQKFTVDQLESLNGLLISPSYYV